MAPRGPYRRNARSERPALTGAAADRELVALLDEPDPESMDVAHDLIEASGMPLRTFTHLARIRQGYEITPITIEHDAKTFAGFIPIMVDVSAWHEKETRLRMFVEWSVYKWKRGEWRTRHTKHTHTLKPSLEPYYEIMVHEDEWFDPDTHPGKDDPNELVLFKNDWWPSPSYVRRHDLASSGHLDPYSTPQIYGDDFACSFAIDVAWGIATLLKQLYSDGSGTAHQLPLETRTRWELRPGTETRQPMRTYADNAILQLIATANLTIPAAKLVKPSEARLRR